MTTFSQMVDELVAESRRRDVQAVICTYINQTIRDVHFNAENNNLLKLKPNLIENQVFADVDDKFVAPLDSPALFARIEAVYFPWRGEYAVERSPSTMFQFAESPNPDSVWYRTGDYLAFSGYGGISAPIWIAWLQFPRRLQYYESTERPATWDDDTQAYVYSDEYDVDDTTRAVARDKTTNWLLLRWPDLIMEGARAKLYKRLADQDRMRTSYSSFESSRKTLIATETYEHLPIFYK